MDEISPSPEVREMFQAAIDVVDAGYRVLRSPGAEKRLGGDYTALQATLRSLEIPLANHARAAEKTPSQAFALRRPLPPHPSHVVRSSGSLLRMTSSSSSSFCLQQQPWPSRLARPASLRPRLHIKMFSNPWNQFWRSPSASFHD